jgi:Zn-dependent peptidase ImmA (M78 family)/DNA-binding XRE family transcriptional regulator
MNGDRIRQARELAAFTQTELAARIDVPQAALAQIEAGVYSPSDSTVRAIAMQTGFDVSFLRNAESPLEFPIGSILYRAQARVSAKDKTRAHRFAQLMFELTALFRSRLRVIPVSLPRLTDYDPTAAAKTTRSALGLSPDTPIRNLVNVVERAGVLVFNLPLEVEGLDGFSAWVGPKRDMPVVCLLGNRRIGYRARYTLGEEIGHLVIHSSLRGTVAQAEDEVKRFTGELLLPEESMQRDLAPPVTLSTLAPLRARWGASLQFLIMRAKDLGVISPNQTKYLMQQVSSRGWRKEEPGDAQVVQETPKAFNKMAELLYGTELDLHTMRKDTGIPLGILRTMFPSTDSGGQAPTVISMRPRKNS